MMANRLAKTFDPQSKEGVQAIQTYMQRAGIKDYEGKEIKADAMFGKRTESGLRQIQDMYERQNMGMSDYGFKNTPPPTGVQSGEFGPPSFEQQYGFEFGGQQPAFGAPYSPERIDEAHRIRNENM